MTSFIVTGDKTSIELELRSTCRTDGSSGAHIDAIIEQTRIILIGADDPRTLLAERVYATTLLIPSESSGDPRRLRVSIWQRQQVGSRRAPFRSSPVGTHAKKRM